MSTINDTDLFIVNRGGTDYKITAKDLMSYLEPKPWVGHDGGIWHLQNIREDNLKLNMGWGSPGWQDSSSPAEEVQVYAMDGTDLGMMNEIPIGLECVIVTPPDSGGLFGRFGPSSPVEFDFGPETDTSKVTVMRALLEEIKGSPKGMENWDTSNVLGDFIPVGSIFPVSGMASLLKNARTFDEDLSGWCVTNIPFKPQEFSYVLSPAKSPQWGTCPP